MGVALTQPACCLWLSAGDLKGNRFTIVLRYVDVDEKVWFDCCALAPCCCAWFDCCADALQTAGVAIEDLSKRGFINFYGMQVRARWSRLCLLAVFNL